MALNQFDILEEEEFVAKKIRPDLLTKWLETPRFCKECGMPSVPKCIGEYNFDKSSKDILSYEYDTSYDEEGVFISDKKIEVTSGKIEQQIFTQMISCQNTDCKEKYLMQLIIEIQDNDTDNTRIIFDGLKPKSERWHKRPIKNLEIEDGVFAIKTKIYHLYNEIINNFNQSHFFSCNVIIGSLLEAICIDKEIKSELRNEKMEEKIRKGKSVSTNEFFFIKLESQLKLLTEKNIIDEEQSDNIKSVRDFRNISTHDIYIPKQEEIEVCIEVIEDILENIYLKKVKQKNQKERLKRNPRRS